MTSKSQPAYACLRQKRLFYFIFNFFFFCILCMKRVIQEYYLLHEETRLIELSIKLRAKKNSLIQFKTNNQRKASFQGIFNFTKGLINIEQQITKQIHEGKTQVQQFKQSCESYIRKAKYFGFLEDQPQNVKEQYRIKMKFWKLQKRQLQKIKKEQEQKKKIAELQRSLRQKKQQQQQAAFEKLKRKKIAQEKIQQILQRKAKRNLIFQSLKKKNQNQQNDSENFDDFEINQEINFDQKQRLYKLLQIEFINNKKKKQQERQQYLRQRKQNMEVSLKNIRIQNEFSLKKYKKHSLQKKVQKQLQLHLRLEQQRKKLNEKLSILKQLQNSISQIPLLINKQKQKQLQIQYDKKKNPKKYFILGRRAMSDSKIYENYKNMDIEVDAKALGNEYLKQFGSNQIDKSRMKSHKQIQNVSAVHNVNSIIQDLKIRRKTRSQQIMASHDIFKKPVINSQQRTFKKKSKNTKIVTPIDLNILLQKSAQHEKKAFTKIIELKNIKNYENELKKELEIDEHYSQALKAKILALQMS